tara:strand:- start:165 stop:890 length:726 start_codon:yes stop_codon:yes gene_type:complete
MAERVCLKHRMPDGTIMDGPVHGAGQHCVEYGTGVYKKGGKIKNSKYTGNGRKSAKHYSAGGYLVGPSHEQGGIQAIVDGTEPIEVEGGEFIINKPTVDSVGLDFLHKLNHTDTPYHTGGFNKGDLPNPSQYKRGGIVQNTQFKKSGVRVRGDNRVVKTTPKINFTRRGADSLACGAGNPCTQNSPKLFETGGVVGGKVLGTQGKSPNHYGINKACTHINSKIDCKKIQGCTWNDSQSVCK